MLSKIYSSAANGLLLSFVPQAKVSPLNTRLQESSRSKNPLFQVESSVKKPENQPINACVLTDLQIELQKNREPSFQKLDTNEKKIKWAIENNNINLLKALLKEGVSVNHDEIEKCLVMLNKETADILSSKKQADQKISGTPPIAQAAFNGDIAKVRELIDVYCDINAKDHSGRTALMLAAEKGYHSIATLLLQQRADSNLGDNEKYTALMIASDQGHTKIVELLLQKGADPNLKNNLEETALRFGAYKGHTKIVELLLQKGADPNLKDPYGHTALMAAAHQGNTKIVKLLLKKGANPNLTTNKSNTALSYALLEKHAEIVKLLLKYGATLDSIEDIDDLKTSEEIKEIINKKKLADQRVDGRPLIINLVLGKNTNKIQFLIDNYCDVNIKDEKTKTTALIEAVKINNLEIFALLLENRANLNLRDNKGNTALIIAAESNNFKIVKILIQKGADLNLKDTRGISALMFSAGEGHHQIVELLLQNGADPNLTTSDGYTALMFATVHGHDKIVNLLIKNGADLNLRDNKGNTALIIAAKANNFKIVNILIQKGEDPNLKDHYGYTALMAAAHQGNTKIVKLLLQKGADPNLKNYGSKTALTYAINSKNEKVVRLLLKYGATLDSIEDIDNLKTSEEIKEIINRKKLADQKIGGRPLIVQAALDKNLDQVRTLIEDYCDISAKDSYGINALMVAANVGYYQIVKLLLQKETTLSNIQTALNLAKKNGYAAVIKLIENAIQKHATLQSEDDMSTLEKKEDSIKKPSTKKKSHPDDSSNGFSFCEAESFEDYLKRTGFLSKHDSSGLTLPLKTTQKLSVLELEKATEIPKPEKKSEPTYHSFMLAAGAALTTAGSVIAYYLHQEKALLNAILQNQDLDAFKTLWVKPLSSQTRQTLTSFLLENPIFVLNFFSQNIELLHQKHWLTFSKLFFDHENHLNTVFSTQLTVVFSTLDSENLTNLYLKIANTSPTNPYDILLKNILVDECLKYFNADSYTPQTLNQTFETLFNSLTPFFQQTIGHLEHMFSLLSIQYSEHDPLLTIQKKFLKKLCDFYSSKYPLTLERIFFETLFSKHLSQLNKLIFTNSLGDDSQLEDPCSLDPIQLDSLNQELILSTPLMSVFSSQRDIQNPADFFNAVREIFPTHYQTNADLITAIRNHLQTPQSIPETFKTYSDTQHSQNQLMIINRPHETLLPALNLLFDELLV